MSWWLSKKPKRFREAQKPRPRSVRAALEQAKHITLFAATQGGKQLDLLAIVGGSSENLANPAHLELCVGEKPKLWLAQQESAYMDSAFFFFFFPRSLTPT